MKNFLQRLFKFFAYLAAGVVILLAIAVGLFRLFLPRLPEYQDEIKSWASAAIVAMTSTMPDAASIAMKLSTGRATRRATRRSLPIQVSEDGGS